jgi:hypothetical protein
MNIRDIFGRRRTKSNGHDEIAYSVSSDEESAFDAVSADRRRRSRSKCISLAEDERRGYRRSALGTVYYETDDDILSEGSSESSSSTASSSTGGSIPDRQTVVYGARRQRADTVRTVFQDPALWRCLDNFQVEYCGGSHDSEDCFPSMSIHRGEPWLFENDMVKDHVAVAVEVSVNLFTQLFRCGIE